MIFKPGNEEAEERILRYTLGEIKAPYSAKGAIVYRIASTAADHYFLLNDGPGKAVNLNTGYFRYKSLTDAVTGEKLPLGQAIPLEADNGRWLRFEK